MTGVMRVFGVAVALSTLFALQAQAQECKTETVTATSELHVSKSFGAYPASWAIWRRKVKEQFGDGWQAWRRARDQKIECSRVKNDAGNERWQCTRSGVPCRPSSGATASACDQYPVISQVLKRGDSGDQVKMLQCLLKEQGVEIAVDGDFGRTTRDAVRAFQKNNGLKVDGKVGDLTAEKLAG